MHSNVYAFELLEVDIGDPITEKPLTKNSPTKIRNVNVKFLFPGHSIL